MKTFYKIVLLMVSVVIAVGGVLIFAKTRVEPPKALKPIDQYADDLQKEVGKIRSFNGDIRKADSLFLLTKKKIAVYTREKKIGGTDAYNKAMLESFVPVLVQHSHGVFNQSAWPEAELTYIKDRITIVRSLPVAFANMENQCKADMNEVDRVLGRYREACKVSMHRSFHGIASAKKSVSLAKEYANDRWLRNCTRLVNDLNQVRPSIGQSHYYYVQKEVDKLAGYRSYSWSYYDNVLVQQVSNQLDFFKNNALKLYGKRYDVDRLLDRAKNYYQQAKSHHEWVTD